MGYGVEEELAEDGAVDFRADVLPARRALLTPTATSGAPETVSAFPAGLGVDLPGTVPDRHFLAFGTGVPLELVSQAVLAQGALSTSIFHTKSREPSRCVRASELASRSYTKVAGMPRRWRVKRRARPPKPPPMMAMRG